ncbi:SCF ubiquitin ligase complex subunit [Mortierella sp. AD094]|nr:SCF ubiquitin ligase complex subunit [Mortierella sp. AD094]
MEQFHTSHISGNAQASTLPNDTLTTCSTACRDLSITQSSGSLWTSASSSCSSLSSSSSPNDMMDLDACSTNNESNESQLPISTSIASITSITTVPSACNITSNDATITVSNLRLGRGQKYPHLPSELILQIFKFLASAHDLRSATLVCKLWCSCGMDLLWSKPSLLTLSATEQMIQTMASPNTIFPYADYIRRLNLSLLGPDLTDQMLMKFASCSRLERLLLAGSVNITAAGLDKILSRCSGLFSLDLSEIPAVTDELLENVAADCPRLHTLYLGSCPAITDESVVKLANNCPQLKRIKLNQCTLLTDRSILTLTQQCPQLIEMDVTNCSLVSNDAIQSIFESLPQIRDINMTLLVNTTNQAFASIHSTTHRFEQLRVLNLTSCALITDETLARIIPAAPRLRSLALTKCDKITDAGASVIKTLGKHLHYLHLGHCAKITDRLVATIAQHCTRIRYLDLACCSKLTDAAVFALAQLPKLRRIGLVKCSNITDHGIYAMLVSQILPQSLERVHLSYCIHLTESAVAALVRHCSKLTHLSVTGVPAFISPRYQKFCRAPPPEFTAHQREVFCVFSGKGVRELRHYMQENPVAESSPMSFAAIQATYRRISSSVALMISGSEGGLEEAEEDEDGEEEPSLAQVGINLLATSAGMIELSNAVMEPAIGGQSMETSLPGLAQGISLHEVGGQSFAGTEDVVMEDQLLATEVPAIGGSVVFHPGPLFPDSSISSTFPDLQHPHHQHQGHRLCSRLDIGGVTLHGTSMEVDIHILEGEEASFDNRDAEGRKRVPSPGTLGRLLDRGGEGSGAGSASPVEEDDGEDF